MKNSITQHLKNKSFFLIGIGGSGMMGIAELLHNLGFTVRGSDLQENNAIKRLRKMKIKIFIGHKKQHIKNATIIVISSAIKKNNPELLEAKRKNLPIIKRGKMLAHIVSLTKNIVVAGSHGKTTTTSLVACLLYTSPSPRDS